MAFLSNTNRDLTMKPVINHFPGYTTQHHKRTFSSDIWQMMEALKAFNSSFMIQENVRFIYVIRPSFIICHLPFVSRFSKGRLFAFHFPPNKECSFFIVDNYPDAFCYVCSFLLCDKRHWCNWYTIYNITQFLSFLSHSF